MRYFLFIFVLSVVLVGGIAGRRGDKTTRPPIELFPDMDRQPKLRPQEPNSFFANRISSQQPVEGAIPRSEPVMVGNKAVYPFEDHPVNTGKIPGTTNWVETIPVQVTAQLMARGKERFQISCLPCHGAGGDGKGITSRYGMVAIANFHDVRLVKMADGEIFSAITNGKNLMGPYGANVAIQDRWAIVAYVRALQRSRLGYVDDVPAETRSLFKK
jgi:mono/diheme cytochrome c family protein